MKNLTLLITLTICCQAQVNVIYEDDLCNDVAPNFPVLHKLADRGEIKILAINANSSNSLSAPAMYIYNRYYGRASLILGTNKVNLSCSNSCNTSTWLTGLISAFNPGDTSSNYPSCVTVDRIVLAAAANSSVVMIETGFETCLNQLLTSLADNISPLTGAQLIKTKVSKIIIMGGDYPSSSGEFNFASDPLDTANVFSTITAQNGYPPIWSLGYTAGNIDAGVPAFAPISTVPAAKAFSLASRTQSGAFDEMSLILAARGLSYNGTTYWTLSASGTNTVNSSTGANSWSSGTASGHYYVTNVLSNTGFAQLIDGYYWAGLMSLPPYISFGTMIQ